MSRFALFLLFALIAFSACRENAHYPNEELSLVEFAGISNDGYRLDNRKIRSNIAELCADDGIMMYADRQTKKYYSSEKPFIWINRLGLYGRADTLLGVLREAAYYGLSRKFLRVSQIEDDIRSFKDLDFANEGINVIFARLEYNLTKAYFRYLESIRFGVVNPDNIYNNIEKYEVDSVTTRFRQLSDLRVERPDSVFYKQAIEKACNDSVGEILASVHPQGELYSMLLKRLNDGQQTRDQKMKTLCNIERCRWRLKILSGKKSFDKYVEVNVPSFSLHAVDKGKTMSMKVGCGTTTHKTPLLTSWIMRMDVNPQWIIPKSISKDYLGRHEYMHRMGMFVFDKKEGKLPPEKAIYNKVMNGEQYLIQAGGPKNSLGRIIFRFDNNFSVFLHDTSSPWVFNRDRRAVSHGCVRVEKPYDLALFMMSEKDEQLEDRLKYSMTVNFINDKDSLRKRNIDSKRLVNSIPVKPLVPLIITYYTIYSGDGGKLSDYQDVYGYDEVLAGYLKPFVD